MVGEKERRIYYQNIVYAVCNSLDHIFGKTPGRCTVCGTAEAPSREVQELMKEVEARCSEWAEMKARCAHRDLRSEAGAEP